MIFAPDLAARVLDGTKTVTRRPVSDNPRSPWGPNCSRMVGTTRAVQDGRGKPAIGRIRILSVQTGTLGRLTVSEARAEGFERPREFEQRWVEMYGSYDPAQRVHRIEFEVVR